ncbi:MAG: hypothetical protein ACREQD_05865, partial [Candidatus Binataceae bacterium]
ERGSPAPGIDFIVTLAFLALHGLLWSVRPHRCVFRRLSYGAAQHKPADHIRGATICPRLCLVDREEFRSH